MLQYQSIAILCDSIAMQYYWNHPCACDSRFIATLYLPKWKTIMSFRNISSLLALAGQLFIKENLPQEANKFFIGLHILVHILMSPQAISMLFASATTADLRSFFVFTRVAYTSFLRGSMTCSFITSPAFLRKSLLILNIIQTKSYWYFSFLIFPVTSLMLVQKFHTSK